MHESVNGSSEKATHVPAPRRSWLLRRGAGWFQGRRVKSAARDPRLALD